MPRLPRAFLVLASLENPEHTHCVDIFRRPDNTYGFEAFRRDPEDQGAWTPTDYHAGAVYQTRLAAEAAAARAIPWLTPP